MKNIKYKLIIKGLKTTPGSIPIAALRSICGSIVEGSRKSLYLSIDGISTHKGRPTWQKDATEFTITGLSVGSTVLEIEAPILEDAIPEQIAQQNLWYKGPKPHDTAISVFSRAVLDVASEEYESDQYDKGVLDTLLELKPVFRDYATDFELFSEERPEENFSLSQNTLEKITYIETNTPEPQAIIISGMFDLIEHSDRKFKINTDKGYKISGVADSQSINLEEMRSFWGKKVTIKGTGYFTASGKTRFIEAHIIKAFEEGEDLFTESPKISRTNFLFPELKCLAERENPLMKLWGKWPGDESIEELIEKLTEISKEN